MPDLVFPSPEDSGDIPDDDEPHHDEPDYTCRVCGGSGGGDEPHMQCRECGGTGQRRYYLEDEDD